MTPQSAGQVAPIRLKDEDLAVINGGFWTDMSKLEETVFDVAAHRRKTPKRPDYRPKGPAIVANFLKKNVASLFRN
ncbi:hypothetical protein MMB17_00400 [Methylobacterium organophilum]|uniref:hypothetical protein n=1 Tax=Methylobacterium organophilum TaxID=410 RepID=UPI001F130CF1|nr:hypothetical protein [Methylobacterium organophilum]UMY17862.1 hypothetical protein MMB17_00400 [Methylobacterium organophilum]